MIWHNEHYEQAVDRVLAEVRTELERAKGLFPDFFANQHEAIAVIREEYLELEAEVFKNQKVYDIPEQRKEAVQLAAMCVRMAVELLWDRSKSPQFRMMLPHRRRLKVGDAVTHMTAPEHFQDGVVVNDDAWRGYTPHTEAVTVRWKDGRETTHPAPYKDLITH